MVQRTASQNAALHVYFTLVAKALNDAGLTVQETLAHQMDIEWSPFRVKELIWKRAQDKFLGKPSTTLLEKNEIDEVYDHVNRFLGSLGIEQIVFPHDPDKIPNSPSYDGRIKQ